MANTSKKRTSSKTAKPAKAAAKTVGAPARKTSAKASAAAARTISQDERRRLIEQAAYYLAEKRGFQGDSHNDWTAAEAEVTADLARKKIAVV